MNIYDSSLQMYNFDAPERSFDSSSAYDRNLINKNIEKYYEDLLNKSGGSDFKSSVKKSSFSFEKFYDDYIEPNMILIVVLVGIVVFLIIRQYSKDVEKDMVNTHKSRVKQDNHEKKTRKKLEIREKEKYLDEYKQSLENDKKNLLRVIDELSSLNEYEYKKMLDAQAQAQAQLFQMEMLKRQTHAKAQMYNLQGLNEYNTNDYDTKYNLNNPNNTVQIDSVTIEPPFTE